MLSDRAGGLVAKYGLTMIVGVVILVLSFPLFWMISTSLKSPGEIFVTPPRFLPETVTLDNYVEAWGAGAFDRYFLNSLITSTVGAFIQVGVALLMAYAFARIRVFGSGILFGMIVMTMLMPEELRLIPNYMTVDALGWFDSYAGLIFPQAVHAFPVLVLTLQIRALPRELFDAARVDGATHPSMLFRVVVPNCVPILSALFLIAFLGRWNDYLWPLVVIDSEHMRTLPLGLAYLRSSQEGAAQWNVLMAGVVFVTMPVIVLYFWVQRAFVEGLLTGGVKG